MFGSLWHGGDVLQPNQYWEVSNSSEILLYASKVFWLLTPRILVSEPVQIQAAVSLARTSASNEYGLKGSLLEDGAEVLRGDCLDLLIVEKAGHAC